MRTNRIRLHRASSWLGSVAAALCVTLTAPAAWAQVHTVPSNPNAPLVNHDIISGKPTTLKAAAAEGLINEDWTWVPGDGSGSCNGSATSGNIDPNPTSINQLDDPGFNPYWSIWCQHTYTGSVGDVFISTVTVDTDGSSGGPFTATYRAEIRANTLPVEVNAAIDEALWHMHRNQFRFNGALTQFNASRTAGPVPMGAWNFPQKTQGSFQGQPSESGAVVNAFEANGYLETGPATSPYTDTVDRGLKYLIAALATENAPLQTTGRAGPGDDPDVNGNGFGVRANAGDPPYSSGMVMDAIVASGTPGAMSTTGPANVINRSYGDIIQDMVDYYAYSKSDNPSFGGWRYGAWNNSNGTTDNSTNGWAAIGMIAAEEQFGATIPQWVKDRNILSLEFTDTESNVGDTDGRHGYVNTGLVWGNWGTSGAAMIQMSMNAIESTTSLTPDERWIRTENFFRRHFNDNPAGANNIKAYYYGMFNFTKAMRTAVPSPVVIIGNDNSVGCGPGGGTPGCSATLAPLDWYNDPVDGLARRIVDLQLTTGVNIGMFAQLNSIGSSNQSEHDTPWATQILTRALFQASPIERASATPNPGAENSPITFDPSDSFHQDPTKNLVLFEWDFDNDGTFDASTPGPTNVLHNFTCPPPGVPCSFPVTLRITDDNSPALTANDIVILDITIPPHPPTAVVGGPYLVCAVGEQLQLDGSGSFDVDEGTSETGQAPFDTITAWEWDLDLASGAPFDTIDAVGESPMVAAPAAGILDIGLRVTDNTAAAFPSAQQPDLTDTDSTTVTSGDCGCIGPLTVRSKSTKNQVVWTPVAGAASYDVARSTEGPNSGFTDIVTGHVTSYATYLDLGLTNGTTYWYRIVPLDGQGAEICDFSAAAAGTPTAGRRRR